MDLGTMREELIELAGRPVDLLVRWAVEESPNWIPDRRSGDRTVEQGPGGTDEPRQLLLDGIPDHLDVNAEVLVGDNVAHSCPTSPVEASHGRTNRLGRVEDVPKVELSRAGLPPSRKALVLG